MPISRREFLKVSGGAIAGVLTGCATTGEMAERPATLPRVPGGTAEIILHNGNVLTVDSQDRISQAVTISKGLIQKVGTDVEISPFNGPATRVINLKGRTVTPGIIDAHNHMIYYGQQMKYQLDIRPPKVRTNKDLLRVVKEARVSWGILRTALPVGNWMR